MQIKQIAAVAAALGAFLPAAVFAQAPAGQRGNRVTGMVQSFTNGTVTVTSRRNPTPVTFTVDATTKVDTSGPTTSAVATAGTAVRVEGTVSADGKSIAATRVTILVALPTGQASRWGKVTANGKRVVGTVTTATPLTVTAGDGTVVAVTTTATTQFVQMTAADQSAIKTGVRVQATLNKSNVAREVTIMPARIRRGAAAP